MTVIVVDAGIGNVGSILSMLRKIGARCEAVQSPRDLNDTDRVILPGVGTFDAGMAALEAHGFDRWLKDIAAAGAPMLGICLGMQLLFEGSEEGGGRQKGLGLIPGKIMKMNALRHSLRLPHMGWNIVTPARDNLLLPANQEEQRFYFVHSYCVPFTTGAEAIGTTVYGEGFTSAVNRGNIFGVQFHPEKSHRFGKGLLQRFTQESFSSAKAA